MIPIPRTVCWLLLVALSAVAARPGVASAQKPNIVLILCDDLGYGDVHCFGADSSKIATPCVDQLARQGMRFTDAHSGSSVCTPTRYGIMTGRYSWRTTLQSGVVTGFAPSLIAADRPTVASFLKDAGYHTAAIGKWHLNMEYHDPTSGERLLRAEHKVPPVGATIPDGPVHRGFDYFHGFHHSREMKAVIENDTVIEHDEVVNMLPRLARKAVEYVDQRAAAARPFFLYLPLCSPHTPIVPSPEWKGKSGLGDYADYVMQSDAVVGAVAAALERHELTENTLVIFTSDNGCSPAAQIDQLAAAGHHVSGRLRGSKADIWEGGHRIPFIVRWPGEVATGSTSDQIICLNDLFATIADIIDRPKPPNSCEDSVSFLPALAGERVVSTRQGVVHHSISGHFAYRRGRWKLALARGSGGWSSPKEAEVSGGAARGQLYDMINDVQETANRFNHEPKIVKQLVELLNSDIRRGRSVSGLASENDVPSIVLWKSEQELAQ